MNEAPPIRGSAGGTEATPRAADQRQRIIDRLKRGQASNSELSEIAQRFGALIHELRAAGHRINIIHRDHCGKVVYALDAEERSHTCFRILDECKGRYGISLVCSECGRFYGYVRER